MVEVEVVVEGEFEVIGKEVCVFDVVFYFVGEWGFVKLSFV